MSVTIPDRIGEVEAWRAWTVIGAESRTPRLRSSVHVNNGSDNLLDGIWPTNRWFVAECSRHTHDDEIPKADCSCGLYAAVDLETLLTYGYPRFQPDGLTAIGKVGFAGRIVEHQLGWRAERGRVLELYLPLSQDLLGKKLSAAYNVPYELAPWWSQDPRLLNLRGV